jgi:hypothetical protein
MKLTTPIRAGLAAAVLGGVAFLTAHGVSAEEAAPAAPMTFNKGDNAWMLTSSVLVLLMTTRPRPVLRRPRSLQEHARC